MLPVMIKSWTGFIHHPVHKSYISSSLANFVSKDQQDSADPKKNIPLLVQPRVDGVGARCVRVGWAVEPSGGSMMWEKRGLEC